MLIDVRKRHVTSLNVYDVSKFGIEVIQTVTHITEKLKVTLYLYKK